MKSLLIVLLFVCSCAPAQNANQGFFKVYRMPGMDVPSGLVEVEDGWIVAGNTTTRPGGAPRYPSMGFLMKIDLKGNLEWTEYLGDTSNYDNFTVDFEENLGDENCLRKLANGDILVTGNTNYKGNYVVMALRFDPRTRKVKWRYQDKYDDNVIAICSDEDTTTGDIYIYSERFYFNRHGYPCLTKLDADGKRQWNWHYGSLQGSGGAIPSYMFLNRDTPFFLVNYSSGINDTCFLVRVSPLTGQKLDSRVLVVNDLPQGMFRIKRGYCLKLFRKDFLTPIWKIDSNLLVIEKKLMNLSDTGVSSIVDEGIIYSDPTDSFIIFADKFGKEEIRMQQTFYRFNQPYSDQFVRMYGGYRKGVGMYYVGYKNLDADKDFTDIYPDCYQSDNCTDIFFMKSDDSGYFFRGPRQPSMGKVLVYPNPTVGDLTVRFDLELSDSMSYELIDVLGRSVLVLESEPAKEGYNERHMDISHLSGGIYTLIVRSSRGLKHMERVLLE